jgi:hypothetical protein
MEISETGGNIEVYSMAGVEVGSTSSLALGKAEHASYGFGAEA